MRTSALVRVAVTLIAAGAALAMAAPASQAAPSDPAAPVVVNDSIAIYPQGMAVVDVLANDTDPNDPDGSSLALCRLPTIDLSTILGSGSLPSVVVGDAAGVPGFPDGDDSSVQVREAPGGQLLRLQPDPPDPRDPDRHDAADQAGHGPQDRRQARTSQGHQPQRPADLAAVVGSPRGRWQQRRCAQLQGDPRARHQREVDRRHRRRAQLR